MGYRAALLSFSKGEVSKEVEARFDLDAYSVGARQARNVTIQRTGGLAKRMGTRFVCEAMGETERLIPFQYSDEQAYVLEFAQAKMRPLALGGAVLEDGLAVSNITKAANAKITAAYHDYEVGDPIYLTGIEGMVEINDRFLTVVSVIDEHNFTVDIDSTGFSTFTGSGGGLVRSSAPTPTDPPPVVPPVVTPPAPPTSTWGNGHYVNNRWAPLDDGGI